MTLKVQSDDSAVTIYRLLTLSTIFVTCTAPPWNSDIFDQPHFLTVQVNNYVRLRSQFNSPYLKFQRTLFRLNVCKLPRYEKLQLCHKHLTAPRHQFIINGRTHPNLGCQRITVELDSGSEVQVAAFKCPTPFRLKIYDESQVALHSSITYYLSGGWINLYMIAYYRHCGPEAKIRPEVSFKQRGMPNLKWLEDFRRKEKYLESVIPNPLMYHDVAPYRLQEKSKNRYRFPEYAENLTKNFIQFVKHDKSPYTKFSRSHRNINVCGLPKNRRIHLCSKAFDADEYDYYADEHKPEILRCEQLEISFNYVKFTPTYLWGFTCGDSDIENAGRKLYYISTGILHKTVLGHIRYEPAVEIIPDVVVRNVDFSVLEDVPPVQKTSKKIRIDERSEMIPMES